MHQVGSYDSWRSWGYCSWPGEVTGLSSTVTRTTSSARAPLSVAMMKYVSDFTSNHDIIDYSVHTEDEIKKRLFTAFAERYNTPTLVMLRANVCTHSASCVVYRR